MADQGTQVGSIFYSSTIDPSGAKAGAEQIQITLKGLQTASAATELSLGSLAGAFGIFLSLRSVIDFFKDSIVAANEEATVMAQTNAVVASTGYAAGYTAEQIKKMADEIQKTTPISNDAAQAGINMLLSFTNLGKDVFPKATQALMDTATALNGGVTPSSQQLIDTAKQLGYAMNDPIQGMSRLHREGVNFTTDQEELVKQLVNTGKTAQAQTIIIDELSKEFGGSAAAQAGTFGGQMQMLRNTFMDTEKEIGNAMVPMLQYLGSAFGKTGGQIMLGIVNGVKIASAAIIELILLIQNLGLALKAVDTSFRDVLSGNASKVGEVWKATGDEMTSNADKAETAVSNIFQKETNKQTSIVIAGQDNQANGEAAKTAKIQKDLEKETQTYQDELAKRTEAFDQSLADMIWAHQDQVASLNKQISDETDNFDLQMARQVQTFQLSMDKMDESHAKTMKNLQKNLTDETAAHSTKVDSIQALIDKEDSYGKNARQSKLTQYKTELDAENAAYATKVSDIQQKVDDENATYAQNVKDAKDANDQQTADRKAAHDKQTADLQASLKKETDILNAHQSEVNSIQDKARVDDITKLEQQHAEENASALKQHNQRMTDIVSQGSAEGTAGTGALDTATNAGMVKVQDTVKEAIKKMGEDVTQQLSDDAKKAADAWVKGLVNGIVDTGKNALSWAVGHTIAGVGPFSVLDIFKNLSHFADGTTNFGGGLAVVGERGPELVNLPSGSDVYSNEQSKGIIGSGINIYVDHIDSAIDIESLAREIGYRAGTMPR